MYKKISEIATIQIGINAKAGVIRDTYYIQARQFDSNSEFIKAISPDISFSNINSKHILKENDILLISKGWKNNAYQWQNHVSPAVASSLFIVIRPINIDIVLPGYLTWYINTTAVQQYLQRNAKGSSTQSITKETLAELEVPIPSIEKQKLIVKVVTLARHQKNILQQLEELREVQLQKLILTTIEHHEQ